MKGGQVSNAIIHRQQIINCIITDNITELGPGIASYCAGGGIYVGGDSSPTISNCIISDNQIGPWGLGGGIYCGYESNLTMHNCIITGNATTGYIGDGGGIYCEVASRLAIVNSTIVRNTASNGGAIYFYRYNNPDLIIKNCIIWDNYPDGIYTTDTDSGIVSYSDIQDGWPAPVGQPPNMNTNPYFADVDDFHLQSQVGRWDPVQGIWIKDANTSPCIDTGSPDSDWKPELWPHGKRINMGAYGGTPQASMSLSNAGNIADLNNNGLVNYADLTTFNDNWLCQKILLPEDLDRNGVVNFFDFVIFANNWQWEE